MIIVRADTRHATCTSDDAITTGSVGIQVKFMLSGQFNGLSAVAVFRSTGASVDVALMSNTCVVPPEVLRASGAPLYIGVYARNSAGTVVIPTVWTATKDIQPGTRPSGVNPSEPTPDWTAQVQLAAQEAVQTSEQAIENSERAIEIAGGAQAAADDARQSADEAAQSATAAAASEAAAREVRESIPADYTALSEDVSELKSHVSLEAYESAVAVDVTSLEKVQRWLKEIPPTTATSGSAYSFAIDIRAYRTGYFHLKTSVITNAATDPKYLWAIVDNDDTILNSSPYQYTAQSVDDDILIPDNAVTLWVGTDTTNIATTEINLFKTRLNAFKEYDETRYDENVTFDVSDLWKVENKYWLTTLPPTSDSYSNAAATYQFFVSQYIGAELHIKASVIGTAATTQKYLYAITDGANNLLIGSAKVSGAQSVDTIVTIPDNAVYLWVGLDTTNYNNADIFVRLPIDYRITKLENSVKKPLYPIICWGDSLTAGAGWVGTPSGFPVVLSEEFGVECKNAGVGGETSSTIAARMGATPVIIPAGAVNGTYATDALKDQWGNPVQPLKNDTSDSKGTVNPILINGIEATLSINTSTYDYTISGYSGEASSVPVEMTFQGQNLTGTITVICVGQNDSGIELEQVIARIDSMIDHCAGEWLVLGRPTGDATSRADEESAMLNKYGGRYLNSRNVVSQYGMTIMGLTPTSADETAIASGAIPPSLLYDTVHLNENGYRAWGKFIAMRIRALGFDKLL